MMDIHGATCPSAQAPPSMPSWNSAPIQRVCAVHAAPLGPRVPDPPGHHRIVQARLSRQRAREQGFASAKKTGKLHRDERWGLQEDFIGILLGFYDVCWFINPISYII